VKTGKFQTNHEKEDRQDILESGDKVFLNPKKWGYKL
jgi:hypothetical protein